MSILFHRYTHSHIKYRGKYIDKVLIYRRRQRFCQEDASLLLRRFRIYRSAIGTCARAHMLPMHPSRLPSRQIENFPSTPWNFSPRPATRAVGGIPNSFGKFPTRNAVGAERNIVSTFADGLFPRAVIIIIVIGLLFIAQLDTTNRRTTCSAATHKKNFVFSTLRFSFFLFFGLISLPERFTDKSEVIDGSRLPLFVNRKYLFRPAPSRGATL